MVSLKDYLDNHPGINWGTAEQAATDSATLLKHLFEDKIMFSEFVHDAVNDARLSELAESDQFRFKIVLYDDLSRGLRVRLHMWKDNFADTPHQHRFPYASHILRGGYEHTVYSANQDLSVGQKSDYDIHFPIEDPKIKKRFNPNLVKTDVSLDVTTGNHYYQGENVELSSTKIMAQTVSLFVRGPAVREASFQWYRDAGSVIWKPGNALSTNESRAQVSVSRDELNQGLDRLCALGIIEEMADAPL